MINIKSIAIENKCDEIKFKVEYSFNNLIDNFTVIIQRVLLVDLGIDLVVADVRNKLFNKLRKLYEDYLFEKCNIYWCNGKLSVLEKELQLNNVLGQIGSLDGEIAKTKYHKLHLEHKKIKLKIKELELQREIMLIEFQEQDIKWSGLINSNDFISSIKILDKLDE